MAKTKVSLPGFFIEDRTNLGTGNPKPQVRPPLVRYRDGETTEFSDIDSDWAASFIAGVHGFVGGVVEGRQVPLTGEEGKAVLQFCRAA